MNPGPPPKYAEWLSRTRESTTPSARSIGRVKARLDVRLRSARAELSSVPGPRPGAAERVKARLAPHLTPPHLAPRPAPWALRGGAPLPRARGSAAFAMAASLVIGGSMAPEGQSERFLAGSSSSMSLSEHVRAEHEGVGRVLREGEELSIDWEIGRIALEVEPGQGATVRLQTPEGVVRVVGTRLVVERDALGTEVSVERGSVSVRCEGGEEQTLQAGHSSECWPTTGAGLLGRARALEQAAQPPDSILATVERGLAREVSGTGPIRAELLSLRTQALLAQGDQQGALRAAEEALAAGPDPIRSVDLHRTAARLFLIWGYCDRAAPHLDALPSLTPEEQAHRDRCAEIPD
jgi:ferric-dicitrate binding protein FerR (iron transport regulator)